jgi:L-alanine-DL-glutamate epimerase-like enolase superfamily enzyme
LEATCSCRWRRETLRDGPVTKGQDHNKLKDEMRSYIDRGYTVVKKKIGGASLDEDLRRIDSILSVLGDGQKLCVDANGRFDLDTAIAYAKALSQYDLFWYEEPGDPLDFEMRAYATTTRTRWPPVKTCSRCRTRAT